MKPPGFAPSHPATQNTHRNWGAPETHRNWGAPEASGNSNPMVPSLSLNKSLPQQSLGPSTARLLNNVALSTAAPSGSATTRALVCVACVLCAISAISVLRCVCMVENEFD